MALLNFDRLLGVRCRLLDPAKLGARCSTAVVESRQIGARNAARRIGVGVGLALCDSRRIRLFAVEDGRDVGDRAGRRDEAGWQRTLAKIFPRHLFGNSNRDVGAPIGGIQGGDHASMNLWLGLSAAGFKILGGAASHARLDDRPADGGPAIFTGLFDRQRGSRSGDDDRQQCKRSDQFEMIDVAHERAPLQRDGGPLIKCGVICAPCGTVPRPSIPQYA